MVGTSCRLSLPFAVTNRFANGNDHDRATPDDYQRDKIPSQHIDPLLLSKQIAQVDADRCAHRAEAPDHLNGAYGWMTNTPESRHTCD